MLNDVNEAPVVEEQTFAVDENTANDTVVGTVAPAFTSALYDCGPVPGKTARARAAPPNPGVQIPA